MRPPCQLSNSMKDTNNFESKHFKEVHHTTKSSGSNSKMVVCLMEHPVCHEQHTASNAKRLCMKANTYESTDHNILRRKRLPN